MPAVTVFVIRVAALFVVVLKLADIACWLLIAGTGSEDAIEGFAPLVPQFLDPDHPSCRVTGPAPPPLRVKPDASRRPAATVHAAA